MLKLYTKYARIFIGQVKSSLGQEQQFYEGHEFQSERSYKTWLSAKLPLIVSQNSTYLKKNPTQWVIGTRFHHFLVSMGQPNLVSGFLSNFCKGVFRKNIISPLKKL